MERRLGSYPDSPRAGGGPLLIVVGGLHGNEPAGVHAARRVLRELEQRSLPLRGQLVALAGNVAALAQRERFRDRDLNRLWTDEEVARARSGSSSDAEAHEQAQLLRELDLLLAQEWEKVVLLDLHSTSAEGSPFSIMADTLQNRVVGFALPAPVLLGLEERIDGTLVSYFSERGHTALCLEGGQNESPATVDHHEAAIWITLASAGLLARSEVPDLADRRALLAQACAGRPCVVEVRHREAVPPGAEFRMRPGFENFQTIEQGDVLASLTRSGVERVVATPIGGLLLMPRYQGKGDDAFFVGRRVRRSWLRVSSVLRHLRLERLLPALPGISRDRTQPRRLFVDPDIARWYVLEILHLFGYRRAATEGDRLEFLRRVDAL